MPEYFDEVADVSAEEWENLRAQGVIGGPVVDPPSRSGRFRRSILAGGRRGGRNAAADLIQTAALVDAQIQVYRREAASLGIRGELIEEALMGALDAARRSPAPFRIVDAYSRLQRLCGPGDLPDVVAPPRTWDDPQADPLADVLEAVRQAQAMPAPPAVFPRSDEHVDHVHLPLPESAQEVCDRLNANLGLHLVPEDVERIRRSLASRDLHAPGRAVDFVTTPEQARAIADSYLAGHRSGSWVRGALGSHESHFEAIERLTAPAVDDGYRYGSDQAAFDTKPDHCWRCCAVVAENDLGTCNPCREDLRGTP